MDPNQQIPNMNVENPQAEAVAPVNPVVPAARAPRPEPAAQQIQAQPPRRKRTLASLLPRRGSTSNTEVAPAMLELVANHPMFTDQRRSENTFVPDSQMMFHVIGLCDQLMITTSEFLDSTPSWLPIVSHLYMSILWDYMILKVFSDSGYAGPLRQLTKDIEDYTQIQDCVIPGPLVPFFQSLAAVSGSLAWLGDILPRFPSFHELWNAGGFYTSLEYARLIPIPAIMLDQLIRFSTWEPAPEEHVYNNFLWYSDIFEQEVEEHSVLHHVAPQHCGSLFCVSPQVSDAQYYWRSALSNTPRASAHGVAFSNLHQLFGFSSQDHAPQTSWFQHVSSTMQKYSKYFDHSRTIGSISSVGLGAVTLHGVPDTLPAVSDWLYPSIDQIAGISSGRQPPKREIPPKLAVTFSHTDHKLEELAEQYAVISHINVHWSQNNPAQHGWTQITDNNLYRGDYWAKPPYRQVSNVDLLTQIDQMITSRYHRFEADLNN